jgi:hypothetical protein
LDGLAFESIDEEKASWLKRPFKESEVFAVVKGMNNENAPSPDGFTMAFFQVCWGVVKADILGVFHEFHAKSLKKALMSLLLLSFQRNPGL